VPGPPTVVFEEDFENVPNPALGQNLANYTGDPPTAMTYTANPAWLNGAACNGIIGSFNSTTGTTLCPANIYDAFIRPIARGMGAALGGGDNNQVMADVTIGGFPAPATPAATLETETPVPLPSTNRFVTFSIDAGAVTCNAAQPLLRFFLLDGASTIPITDNAINACTDPRGTTVSGVRVGSYASDASIFFSGNSLGVKLTNDQTSGGGNDYAVDNLRVLDATPQLDKTFESPTVRGQPTTLTFTITNTSDLAAKEGWSFTDTLPAGLEVASPAGTTTNCTNGSVTAAAGGATIDVSGDLEADQEFCTATVQVVADEPGGYENCPQNVSDLVGLDPPACDELTVLPEADLELEKSGDTLVSPGGPVTWLVTVTNNGPDASTGSTVTDTVPPGVTSIQAQPASCAVQGSIVTCDLGPLAPGASQSIAISGNAPQATGTCFENEASVEGDDEDPDQDNNEASARTCTPPVADLEIEKSATPPLVDPGGQVTWTLTVTNNGPNASSGATVTDTLPGDVSDVASPTPGCTVNGNEVSCNVGPLNADASTDIIVTGTAPNTPSTCFPNDATVEGDDDDPDEGDPDLANNEASVETCTNQGEADLEITKAVDPAGAVKVGELLTYTLTITNHGPNDAVDVAVGDGFGADVRVESVTPSQGACTDAPPISCQLGTIADGAAAAITIEARPLEKGQLANAATVDSTAEDPDPTNNDDATSTDVRPVKLSVKKKADRRKAEPGDVIDYEIDVRSRTDVPLRNLKLCDKLPKQLELVSAPGANAHGHTACWRFDLPANGSKSFRVRARVKPTKFPLKVRNTAKVTGGDVRAARGRDSVGVKPDDGGRGPGPCKAGVKRC
jgi:uncharacterized repeat protein (TIGR01451 family)